MSKSPRTPETTPAFNQFAGAHKPFDWIYGEAKNFPMAKFVSLVHDISSGIQTCLELVNSSELDRSHNSDADPGDETLPTLNPNDTSRLLRLAMASAELLSYESDQKIDWLNKFGTEYMAAQKRGAK